MKKIMMMVMMVMMVLLIECKDNRRGESYYYLEREAVKVETKVIPVYMDHGFSKGERAQIGLGFDRWNKVMNGYLRFDIIGEFDMEVEVLKKASRGEAYLVLRLEEWSELIHNESGEKTLGFANAIGGSYLYLVPGAMGEGDMYGVVLHEVGHLLGARHTDGGLMDGRYNRGGFVCIDKETVMMVGGYWGYEWEKMNYCVVRIT